MREIIVTFNCPFCGKEQNLLVMESDYLAWQDGKSTWSAFPYLSETEREQMISHICPTCQDNTFKN